jgi:hypothetical protein
MVKDNGDPAKRKLRWLWQKGTAAAGDLGVPTESTSYSLCVYIDGALATDPTVEAGGTCGEKPCWKAAGLGFAYANRGANGAGIVKIKLKPGDGKAKILFAGKGANLDPLLPVPLGSLVTVQLVKNPGAGPECWEAIFPAPAVNSTKQFKDAIP